MIDSEQHLMGAFRAELAEARFKDITGGSQNHQVRVS